MCYWVDFWVDTSYVILFILTLKSLTFWKYISYFFLLRALWPVTTHNEIKKSYNLLKLFFCVSWRECLQPLVLSVTNTLFPQGPKVLLSGDVNISSFIIIATHLIKLSTVWLKNTCPKAKQEQTDSLGGIDRKEWIFKPAQSSLSIIFSLTLRYLHE